MKTLEATTQLGGFNQFSMMNQSNKRLPYIGNHWHKDDAIITFLSSLKSHCGNTAVKLIVGTKELFTDVYAIWSKSGLNISKFLQDRLRERGIPINIWSDNAQEEFMGILLKLLCAYGVGSNQSEAQKQNHNPDEYHIQDIKGITSTVLDHSIKPICSYILFMAYVVSIIKCMDQRSLYWLIPHEDEYVLTKKRGVWILGTNPNLWW